MKNSTILKTLIAGAGLVTAMAVAPATYAGGKNGCSEYRLSAYGGDAGFRVMSGSKNFRKTHNGSVVGQICHSGRVQVELSKRDPGTHVSLAVNGREYVFGQGDRGDRHVNNWFRRYVHLDLGHYSKPRKWKGRDHDDSDYGHNNQRYGSNNGHHKANRYGYNGRDHDYDYRGRDYDDGYVSRKYDDDDGYYQHHNHKPKWKPHHRLPRFAVHSKRHRKAHRRNIPHKHKRHHRQRYVTYY